MGSTSAAALRARALAAGAPPAAADALLAALPTLSPRERAQVHHPLRLTPGADRLRFGTAAAAQVDGTTCGAAVLVLLAAAGDPTLTYWLVTGGSLAGHRPELVADLEDGPGPAARFGALQESVHRRSTARELLGLLSWPRSLGTPPWGAARAARFPGVAYRSVPVDDTRPDEVADVLARADRALAHGVPVPLYVGGDLSGGPAAAVPRHVVLLTARTGDDWCVYDPSTGRLHTVPTGRWAPRDPSAVEPLAAFGGWSHLCWAVLPVACRRRR